MGNCCSQGGSHRESDAAPTRPIHHMQPEDKKKPIPSGMEKNRVNQHRTNHPEQAGASHAGPSHPDKAGESHAMSKEDIYPSDQKHSVNGKGGQDGVPTDNPPPYHNWQEAVPDTSILPPPPVQAYLYSNTGNASSEQAERAHDFCDNTPLWTPHEPSNLIYNCVRQGDLRPVRPHEYEGTLDLVGNGRWKGCTTTHNGDAILLTSLPLFFAMRDSPMMTEVPNTIYFEVKLLNLYGGTPTQTPGFSIGYAAQPYPTWRSPGWERGSVGVFSDDGCRFVNDSWGGREFTTEFKVGETVGLGMTFALSPEASNSYHPPDVAGNPSAPITVDIFFTRNGQKVGNWNLHEEVDEDSGGVEGLEGNFDLYGAVGLFGGVEFEVCFDRSGWLWVPPSI
ncbi:hypothetical protein FQN57_000810 [Myotisia sp. PD_48]|nr:hypothetical protein FQN57_000810 [Myotisia sp. PD_48]